MEIIRCPKGHFYDADKCSTCPVCANENGTQEFTLGGNPNPPQAAPVPTMADYSATEPVNGFNAGGISPDGIYTDGFVTPPQAMKTEAFKGGNEKVNTISETAPVDDKNGQANAKKKVDDYDPTMPAGIDTTPNGPQTGSGNGTVHISGDYGKGYHTSPVPTAFNPVTGWLVCVEGASKGTDYRIRSQYNYIGRAKHMDICISGDEYISSEKAAILAYDDMERKFFIAPGMGHNLIRLNDKMVMGSEILKAYDVITVGKTKLLFIPLCGEQFDWKNV